MTSKELDRALALSGKGMVPIDVHKKLEESRKKKGEDGPALETVRRALKGTTHKRGKKETRGRKPKLTPLMLRKLQQKRLQLILEADNDDEVHLEDVMNAAGVNHVDPSTVSKHFK